MSRSSIRDPSNSAASPKFRSELRRYRSPRKRLATKWSSRVASRTSLATTSPAPRRSSSNAQKPSIVPMSRQRMPSSDGGHGSRAAVTRRSQPPGVTTPGATSIVCHQSSSATRLRATSGSIIATLKTVQATSGSLPARHRVGDCAPRWTHGWPRPLRSGEVIRSRRIRR